MSASTLPSAAASCPRAGEVRVAMSALAVAREDATLVAVALGSCVAITLWDPVAGAAALAHVMLPDPALSREHALPARFAGTAVPALQAALRDVGAPGPYVARLVGGASMFRALLDQGGLNVGARNVEAARAALREAGIACAAEDVGGEHGRTVQLHAASGRLLVRSLAAGDREL